jgi:uncharacterized protein with HEPN domain
MCDIRNKLAHERDQDMPFATVWASLTDGLPQTEAQNDRLMSSG